MASQFISSIPQFYHQTPAPIYRMPAYCCCNKIRIVSQTRLSKPRNGYNKIKIKSLDNCKLNISQYSLLYNGQGCRGTGNLVKMKEDKFNGDPPQTFEFDLRTVHIPPVTSQTAKFVGHAALPPFFKIDVVPETIRADIYAESGKIELTYKAKLWLSIGSGYKAPPLLLDMIFTTEELKAALIKGTRGKRLDRYGKCKLVGVARVDPIDDQFINSVIGLPADCLTSLNATVSFF